MLNLKFWNSRSTIRNNILENRNFFQKLQNTISLIILLRHKNRHYNSWIGLWFFHRLIRMAPENELKRKLSTDENNDDENENLSPLLRTTKSEIFKEKKLDAFRKYLNTSGVTNLHQKPCRQPAVKTTKTTENQSSRLFYLLYL